jgi:hypothetical protein
MRREILNEKPVNSVKSLPRWVWLLGAWVGLAGATVILDQIGSGNDDAPSAAPMNDFAYHPSKDLPSGVVMDDREKALYDADPSSMGYTKEDREFLREHGMSEEEARAAESVMGNPD